MEALYTDEFIDVFQDHLLLKGYYFLRFGNKRIEIKDIETFKEVRLTFFNGMSRHEKVWLEPRIPFDWKIKGRKEAFYVKTKGALLGIGISATNPREAILALQRLLPTSPLATQA